MPQLRDMLRSALGLGMGSATTRSAALGSLRGQIILVGPVLADEIGTRHAVVVANPRYSRVARFLNIIPLYDAEEYESTDVDVVLEAARWARGISPSGAVLVSVSAICSCFMKDPETFDSQLGIVVDDSEIAQIDHALERHFFGDE